MYTNVDQNELNKYASKYVNKYTTQHQNLGERADSQDRGAGWFEC